MMFSHILFGFGNKGIWLRIWMLNLQWEARQKKETKTHHFPFLVAHCKFRSSLLKKPSLPRGSHREYFFWLEEKICILAGGRTGERAGRPLVARKRIKEVDIAQELLRGACLSSLLFFSRKIKPQKSEICSHKQVRGQKNTLDKKTFFDFFDLGAAQFLLHSNIRKFPLFASRSAVNAGAHVRYGLIEQGPFFPSHDMFPPE